MKISPSTLLASLIAMASVGGAVLHSKKISKQSTGSPAQQQQIDALQEQVSKLQAENKTLKNLQGTGLEVTLPISHYKFVEDNLGLTFPKHVKAIRVDDDILEEAVRNRYIQKFGLENMLIREYAFQKLGMFPLEQDFLDQLAIAETAGAVCIYDSSANEILLSAEFDNENLYHTTSLIKQLSVALLEKTFALTKTQVINLTDDNFFAREGFIRGRSSSIALRYRNINAFRGDSHNKPPKPNLEAQQIFNSLSSLVQGLTTFPAVHGKTYIEDIIINHDSVFPEIYSNMPKTTAVIFSKKMPSTDLLPPQPPMAENEHLNTQLGQLFVMLYLQQIENPPQDLHQKMTSDRLILSQNLTDPSRRNEHTTTWKTHWKTPEDAQKFLQLATQITSSMEQKPTLSISDLSENQVIIQFLDIHNS